MICLYITSIRSSDGIQNLLKPLFFLGQEKKWVNLKVVNQVGTKVRLTSNRVLPQAVLSSGDIFVYHRLLKKHDKKANITLHAVDAYTDKPLMLNGKFSYRVRPVTYSETQETYVTRLGKKGWFCYFVSLFFLLNSDKYRIYFLYVHKNTCE